MRHLRHQAKAFRNPKANSSSSAFASLMRTLDRHRRVDVVAELLIAAPGGRRKFEINPMKNYATRPGHLKRQSRCGARTRAGAPCRRPPVRGHKRCRLHGGLSPGAPRGLKNGNYKTGDWTSEAITERKWLRSLVHSFAKSRTTE